MLRKAGLLREGILSCETLLALAVSVWSSLVIGRMITVFFFKAPALYDMDLEPRTESTGVSGELFLVSLSLLSFLVGL